MVLGCWYLGRLTFPPIPLLRLFILYTCTILLVIMLLFEFLFISPDVALLLYSTIKLRRSQTHSY